MPSFAWISRFREGSWLAFRKFMLEERQDVNSRFAVIDAERERIGDVTILYKKDANGKPTEERVGISIEPDNSSIAKLLQAYCALGGNPFDISMFLSPETPVIIEDTELLSQPGKGVAYMTETSYSYDQGSKDGDPNLLKYKTSRVGGRVTLETESTTGAVIQRGRKWISKEIMNKRVRLEERIIKLCDLREQLDQEVEDMVWAMHGDMQADESFDTQRYNIDLTAARIAYRFDSSFRIPEQDYTVNFDNNADADTPGAPNLNVLGGYPNLISDAEEEKNTAL